MRNVKSHLLATGCAIAGMAIAFPSFAQETAPAVEENQGVGDIVVTAQKRQSTAQKTAVAMTVFDTKTLARNGVNTLQDLTKLAPSVSLGQNSANVIVTIRGVSSRDTNEIAEPAVAVSIDGFSIQRPTGLSDSVYDLERVEVLRGPQGTLYGRSATGGAINFLTAKPTDKFEGRVSLGYGNYDEIKTEGMLNVPVTDTLAVRASFATTKHDGYRTNEAPARAGDDADNASGRISIQWKPTDRLKLLLTGQYTTVGGVGPTVTGYPYTTISYTYKPDIDQDGVSHSLPNQYIDVKTKSIQLTASYDFDFASLIYVGGYRDMEYHQLRDLDGNTNQANYYQPNENPVDQQHEIRLVSTGSGPFKWQTGVNYFHEDNDLLTYYQTYASSASGTNRYIYDYSVKAKSIGVFGQASYEIVPGVTAEAGIRYSHDEKTREGYQNLNGGAAGSDQSQNGESKSSKVTYHAALNWQATPDNLLYAKYDTGYKPGGFSTVIGVGVQSYDPETITSVEVGSKNQFWDRRIQLNLSAFHYDYSKQQVSVSNPNGNAGTQGVSYTINAGKSEIYGLEAEAVAQPTPDDRLDLSAVYLHARYTDLCTAYDTSGVCTTDFSGNRSVQAPTWTFNAGYEHTFHVFSGTLTPRVQTHYESYTYLGIENRGFQYQPSYWRSDAMVTFTAGDNRWNLNAYIKNIGNTVVITSAASSFGAYNYGLAAPRTYGAKLTYNF